MLDKLEIYPTQVSLYLDFDESNSAFVEALDLYCKDEKGNIFGIKQNGVSGTGNPDNHDIRSIHFESNYFMNTEQLTLYINGISLISKDEIYGEINYSQKSVTNLPEGVAIDAMELIGSTLGLTFTATFDKPDHYHETISSQYYDMEGDVYNFGSWNMSQMANKPGVYYLSYKIKDYRDHKYKVRWTYAPMMILDEPVSVIIK